MKLKNKRTGKVVEFFNNTDGILPSTLAELCEEYEDCEEPKGSALDLMILTLIDFIENKPDEVKVDLEDCKEMLEKLKAWRRLKDKGFRFNFWYDDYITDGYIRVTLPPYSQDDKEIKSDLDLLFYGGEK